MSTKLIYAAVKAALAEHGSSRVIRIIDLQAFEQLVTEAVFEFDAGSEQLTDVIAAGFVLLCEVSFSEARRHADELLISLYADYSA